MADETKVETANPSAGTGSVPRSSHALGSEDTLSESTSNQPPITSKEVEDVPPNGGYGWVCVVCVALINAHTWGINSTYGVFLSYYLSHNYFPNTSALVYAFIGGLSISMALLSAPLGTQITHLYGTKVCLHIGIFFETLSLVGASFAREKYQIILAQGVCFGWGMGFLFVGSVGIVAQWFTTKRSLANGFVAAGSGIGALVYSLATERIIETLGLPWAFRILGIVSCVVNLVACNVVRDRNRLVGSRHKAFDLALLKRPEYLLLQGWSFFSMLGYVVLLFSVASFAVSIGLTPQQGSLVSALLNLGQGLGRPCVGLSSDRFGRINVAMICTLACGICCFAFWIPSEAAPSKMGLLIFFAIVGGAFAGTFWATIAAVGAEVVGLRDLPSALSMTWVLAVPPTTFAEPIALELRTKHGSNIFINAQIFTGMMYVGGALCLWVLRGWKVGEIEEMERRLQAKGIGPSSRQDAKKEAIANNDQASLDRSAWQAKDLVRRMATWRRV